MTSSTDMKKILETLEVTLNKVVNNVVEEGNPIIHKKGILGNTWEIVKEDVNHYRIFCKETNNTLVDNIELYEVAFNIACLLTKGNAIESEKVKKIIRENEQFCKYFYEAIFYNKKRKVYAKQGNWHKHDLMETQFEIARDRAIHAREKLRNSKQKS
jgi:hypothetical protein